MILEPSLSQEQQEALALLQSGENIFLTGGAGCGKSFVIREFMKDLDPKIFPILASTGTAAVLLGGRTFHSFFGLGIMEGGPEATFERASKDQKVLARIKRVEGFVMDEVSMIPGSAFRVAEALARVAKESNLPWGGLRVIAVGDFLQLPPVTQYNQKRDWCFRDAAWDATGFRPVNLTINHRVEDAEYLRVLETLRQGKTNEEVKDYLNDKLQQHDEDWPGTRLFPRRIQSEEYNFKKLRELPGEDEVIPSIYLGPEKFTSILMKSAPVPEKLFLRVGCQVMFIQNDPNRRWVNGTKGEVVDIQSDKIIVKKYEGRQVQVEKVSFSMQDAEGNVVASVIQFPLMLAYSTTIHKSQGATLDEIWCDLGALWEPGQAYVALSRLRTGQGLHLLRWSPRSIMADPHVLSFYQAFHRGLDSSNLTY
jgi:ATP-dependent exoDNAse (exonuclease V) alpha subunit